MNFWESTIGQVTGNESDAFAKQFVQIPNDTMALAKIVAFVNTDYMGDKYLTIDWLLTDGDFKGQKVNQKLKVFGDSRAKDSEKARFRALNMLMLIYKTFDVKPTHAGSPTNKDLELFVSKVAGIKIQETEPNDEGKQYNWVSEVHKKEGFVCETGKSVTVTHKASSSKYDTIDSAFDRNSKIPIEAYDDGLPF